MGLKIQKDLELQNGLIHTVREDILTIIPELRGIDTLFIGICLLTPDKHKQF